jgi:hypothetical protein
MISLESTQRSTVLIKGQSDIRKLYTPPMKNIMLPSRNPFLNGTIVDYTQY